MATRQSTTVFEGGSYFEGPRWRDGSLVIVSMRDHRLLRLADGELATLADLGAHCGGLPNDCVVDEAGHVFVGDFGFDLMGGSDFATASLERVDPDGTVTVVADDLHVPNGAVITPEGTLIVGETWGNRFTAFDVAADGSLGDRRVWASFGPVPTGTSMRTPGLRCAKPCWSPPGWRSRTPGAPDRPRHPGR